MNNGHWLGWARAALWAAAGACAAPAVAAEPSFGDIIEGVVGVRAEIPESARTARSLGTQREGSGVVVDATGLVLTIGYLIMEAERAWVVPRGGEAVPADVLAYDNDSGFGMLRARQPLAAKPLQLGDSDALEPGDPVLVASVGGLAMVRPARVVSRRNYAGYWEYLLDGAVFTAPPHPLFGGAALLGADGRLLGIGSLAVPDAMARHEVPGNMFVPVARLRPILGDLLGGGRVAGPAQPWLGIHSHFEEDAVRVDRIAEDGPSEAAGLRPGDRILAVDQRPVRSLEDFYRKVRALGHAGVEVPLLALRDGDALEFRVRSRDRRDWLRLNPR